VWLAVAERLVVRLAPEDRGTFGFRGNFSAPQHTKSSVKPECSGKMTASSYW
jgi:hypothetical protein